MSELDEARQLADRYRSALERIVEECGRWCDDYAMCDHAACRSSARSWQIALDALNVKDPIYTIGKARE